MSHSVPPRNPIGLTIKLPWRTLDEFVTKFKKNLSDGGMFVQTHEPKPRGTELAFKVVLATGQVVLAGNAISRWTRGDGDPLGPAGMGVEFLSLEPRARNLVNRMLGRGNTEEVLTAPPPTEAELFGDDTFGATFSDPEVFELLKGPK